MALVFFGSPEEFDSVIDENDENEEANVGHQIHVEEFVWGAILLTG